MKKPLRVAMVTPWRVRCGIFTYSRNLINSLVKYGVEVFVVRLPRFGILTSEILQNVVDKIPVDHVDLIHVEHEYGLYKGLEGGFYGGLARLGKPIVTTMHAVGNFEVDPVIANSSVKVIVHNKFCYSKFGFHEKTVIIPHGALGPIECPPADECKKRLGIDPRIPIVGYLGFISRYKGLETLIQAVTKIPNIALLIGGGYHVEPGTEYIARLKEWSLNVLPGRCQWLGYVPDEEMKYVYGAMDLFVYPSLYVTESGALITALSHCRAVIASSVPPFREKERKKALVTFKDIPDLVEKINYFIFDEKARKILMDGAKKYVRNTCWDKIARKHIRLYHRILF